MTDITYIRTWEGWLYVAVVLDLLSRRVMGWASHQTVHLELALDAILMAVRRRKPIKTIIYSDQRSRYSSDDWHRLYETNNLEPSMSRRGNCWANTVAQSFFSSLKKEGVENASTKIANLQLRMCRAKSVCSTTRPVNISILAGLVQRSSRPLLKHS